MLYAWKLRFWGCSGDLFVAGDGGGLLKGVYGGIVGWGGWRDPPAAAKATMVKGVFAGLSRRILVDLSTSSMSPNFLFTFRNYCQQSKEIIDSWVLTSCQLFCLEAIPPHQLQFHSVE